MIDLSGDTPDSDAAPSPVQKRTLLLLSREPAALRAVGNELWFQANDGGRGVEPWVTDSTPAGTRLLRDLGALASSSQPDAHLAVDRVLLFTADDDVVGRELWRSDGTAAGTTLVADVQPGAAGSDPSHLVSIGRTVLFAASEPGSGRELWRTDGSAGGTALVVDLVPGPNSSLPTWLTPFGGGVLYTAYQPALGEELHFADLMPGPLSVTPGRFIRVGATVFFNVCHASTGEELWSLPARLVATPLADLFGQPCAVPFPRIGARGAPSLGNAAFGVELRAAPAHTPALLLLNSTRTDIALGCTLYPTPPGVSVATQTDGAGRAFIGLPVPNLPVFVGAPFFAQWAAVLAGGPVLGALVFSDGLFLMLGR